MGEDISVGNDSQSSEDDDHRDRHLDVRKSDVDDRTSLTVSHGLMSSDNALTVPEPEALGYILTSVSLGIFPPFSI